MKLKKQFIVIILIIFLFIINSGCISPEDSTTFTMLSKTIIDDNGFPSLNIHFKTNDFIKINIINPEKQIYFTDIFYSSQNETTIPISTYNYIPQLGAYQLQVYDKNNHIIYNETFSFDNINFSIISGYGHWWKENIEESKYSLIGITLLVKNNCNLPLYPYSLDFIIDNKSISTDILPAVVLPGKTRTINCSIYINDMVKEKKNCNVFVYDKNDELLANFSFQTIPQENVLIKNFSWEYNGKKEISVPYLDFLFDYYSSLKRLDTNNYAAYVFDPYDDLYLTLIMNSFISILGDADNISKINLIASFVQNLDYGEDDLLNSTYEYPLYPVELLNNQLSDCEDRSIFIGNILMLMNYNVSLISLPEHMAVGVNINQNLSDYDFYIDEYYYLETIEKNMVLGDVLNIYRSFAEEAVIYPLTPRPIVNHFWVNADGILANGKIDIVKLKLIVENNGNLAAENIMITAAFYSSNDVEYKQEKINVYVLQPLEKKQIFLNLNVPKGISTILKTRLYLDDNLLEEKKSATKFP